jgi:hypothetical protein
MGVINEKSFVGYVDEVKNSLQDYDSHTQEVLFCFISKLIGNLS